MAESRWRPEDSAPIPEHRASRFGRASTEHVGGGGPGASALRAASRSLIEQVLGHTGDPHTHASGDDRQASGADGRADARMDARTGAAAHTDSRTHGAHAHTEGRTYEHGEVRDDRDREVARMSRSSVEADSSFFLGAERSSGWDDTRGVAGAAEHTDARPSHARERQAEPERGWDASGRGDRHHDSRYDDEDRGRERSRTRWEEGHRRERDSWRGQESGTERGNARFDSNFGGQAQDDSRFDDRAGGRGGVDRGWRDDGGRGGRGEYHDRDRPARDQQRGWDGERPWRHERDDRYAREERTYSGYDRGYSRRGGHDRADRWRRPGDWTGDWLCTQLGCGATNFMRREECFKCQASRRLCGVPLSSAKGAMGSQYETYPFGMPASGTGVVPPVRAPFAFESGTGRYPDPRASELPGPPRFLYYHIPTRTLIVRDLRRGTGQAELQSRFSAFGPVEAVVVVPEGGVHMPGDVGSNAGFAFVIYPSAEVATHALAQCNEFDDYGDAEDVPQGIGVIRLDGRACTVTFARDDGPALAMAYAANMTHPDSMSSELPADPRASAAAAQAAAAAAVAAAARIPLPFETHGGYYVFDPKTGFFYEHSRQFWYDTVAKLYLDAVYGGYYALDASGQPQQWIPPLPTEARPQPAPEPTAAPASAPAAAPVAPAPMNTDDAITILPPSAAPLAADAAQVESSHSVAGTAADLERWKRAQEARNHPAQLPVDRVRPGQHVSQGSEPAVGRSPAQPVAGSAECPSALSLHAAAVAAPSAGTQATVPTSAPSAAPTTAAPAAAGVAAVCHLCRRGFPSADVLQKHEAKSELHRSNLVKLAAGELTLPEDAPADEVARLRAAAGLPVAVAPPAYRDRAAERRQQFGVVFPGGAQPADRPSGERDFAEGPALALSNATSVADTPLDAERNVGAALMAKMGWSGGAGLGKHNQGMTAPLDAVSGMGGVVDGSRKGLGASTQRTLQ